jgi:hypothetical protein
LAVLSSHPRLLEDRRLDGVEMCQSNEVHCSLNKDVCKRRTVHLALPLIVQVSSLPEV